MHYRHLDTIVSSSIDTEKNDRVILIFVGVAIRLQWETTWTMGETERKKNKQNKSYKIWIGNKSG